MISLKRYLDSVPDASKALIGPDDKDVLSCAISVYGSALTEMGNCSLDACPGLGEELKEHLGELKANLSPRMSCGPLAATESAVREQLGKARCETLSAESRRGEGVADRDGADGRIGWRAR